MTNETTSNRVTIIGSEGIDRNKDQVYSKVTAYLQKENIDCNVHYHADADAEPTIVVNGEVMYEGENPGDKTIQFILKRSLAN